MKIILSAQWEGKGVLIDEFNYNWVIGRKIEVCEDTHEVWLEVLSGRILGVYEGEPLKPDDRGIVVRDAEAMKLLNFLKHGDSE